MSGKPTDSAGTISAEDRHCGVCQHVTFREDWDRTPYCSLKDRAISIRVGDVCAEFTMARTTDDEITDGGDHLDVDWTEPTRGSSAPFYIAYRDDERYGWVCGACRTHDVAVGPMGRIMCNECGNTRKPTEWDPAYL